MIKYRCSTFWNVSSATGKRHCAWRTSQFDPSECWDGSRVCKQQCEEPCRGKTESFSAVARHDLSWPLYIKPHDISGDRGGRGWTVEEKFREVKSWAHKFDSLIHAPLMLKPREWSEVVWVQSVTHQSCFHQEHTFLSYQTNWSWSSCIILLHQIGNLLQILIKPTFTGLSMFAFTQKATGQGHSNQTGSGD